MPSKTAVNDALPQTSTVLVVGAGPTGLACGVALRHLGVEVIVVDAGTVNTNGSRATVLHAHTLEVLESIGCITPLLSRGLQGHGFSFFNNGHLAFRGSTEEELVGMTKYPFVLHLPQVETELILEMKYKELGGILVRNKKVVSYEESSSGVKVSIEGGESVITKYLVAADGSKSTIRRLTGLNFADPITAVPYDTTTKVRRANRFIFSDVYFALPTPQCLLRDRLTGHFCPGSIVICIPQPIRSSSPAPEGANPSCCYRMAITLTENEPDPPENIDIAYLQALLDVRDCMGPVRLKIFHLISANRYVVRNAVADKFFVPIGREGKLLFAGDSAHVHSPAGGQGVNLGICDAVALADAILRHAKSLSPGDSILQEYAETRRKIAIEVISFTGGMDRIAEFSSGWKRVARDAFFFVRWLLPAITGKLFLRISGLIYRDSMPKRLIQA